MTTTTTIQKRTACNRDCPDACGIIATIQDDRVVRLQGDPDHPVTRGFLCHRTSRFLSRQYHPERLTTPLLRRGDQFEPISWDAALDQIASQMLKIRRESGPAAILNYRSGGSLGLMKHVTDYFFDRFGPVTVKSGDICAGAGEAAQIEDFGEFDSHELFDILNSKTIVLWGKNVYVSNVHLLPILKEARERGAQLILIDPVWHRTADLCELYVQPRPGADVPLGLGIAQRLFARELADPSASTYCEHFDEFRALANSRSVEEWAELADVPAAIIDRLADCYAHRPTATLVGWGLQRRTHGAAAVRVIDAVAAISGNLGVAGGGVSFYFKRRGAFDFSSLTSPEPAPRAIPEPLLGPGILALQDPPIRMVWVTAGNPVVMLPESGAVSEALQTRELTVVVDSFLTDTARCAHLVLPTTTMLEDDDLLGSYGHHWLAEVRPVVAPPAGVKTDYEIIRELAPRLGLGKEFADDVEAWKVRLLSRITKQGVARELFREGPVRSPFARPVLFAGPSFPTPSGRMNLVHGIVAAPPRSTPEWPLLLAALSTQNVQGSQWLDGEGEGHPVATVHPDAAPGYRDGDVVVVRSAISELTVQLHLDPRQRRDVLLVPKGGWLRNGRCANSLIRAQETDAGGCAVLYDTPVRIQPAT